MRGRWPEGGELHRDCANSPASRWPSVPSVLRLALHPIHAGVGVEFRSARPILRARLNRRAAVSAKPSFAVIGAGIGGLAVAAFLTRQGANVTIYEQAKQFLRIGAGI